MALPYHLILGSIQDTPVDGSTEWLLLLLTCMPLLALVPGLGACTEEQPSLLLAGPEIIMDAIFNLLYLFCRRIAPGSGLGWTRSHG